MYSSLLKTKMTYQLVNYEFVINSEILFSWIVFVLIYYKGGVDSVSQM